MNIFKKIPAVIASVAVIVSLSAVAVSANSYVPEVSDVVTEDIEVVFDSATKAQREQAQQIIADYIAKNIPNGIADVSKMDKVAAYVASFTYDKSNSDPYLMVLNGSGSDYASAKLAVYMLEQVGLTAKIRYAYSENEEIPMKTATSMATTAVRLGDGSVYLLYIGGDVLGQKTFISQKLNSRFLYKEISKNKYAVYSWIQFDDEVKGYDKATKTVMNIPGYIDGHKIEVIAKEFTRGCIGVSKVTIPNTVTEIQRGAFVYTKRIQSISISSSVNKIADDVFSGNNCLKFTVDSNNKYFQAINGDLYSKDGKTLVSATGSSMTKIPSFVEVIGGDAFCGNNHIVDITIPATVKKISYAAFASCDNLRNVIIEGNGLTTVESRAFQTTKLISLNIPSSVTSFSYDAFDWAEIILVVCPDGEISQKLTGKDKIQNLLVDTSGTLTGRTFTKKPTCESDGELKVNFSTGSSKTYTIPKSNLYHDYKVDAIKSEACANDGSITYRCAFCNSHRTEDTTYATGHSFSSTWTLDKAPTCAEQGSQSRHCTKCDKKTDVIYVSPTGNHTYTAWKTTKNPDCTKPGEQRCSCTVCGKVLTRELNPLGHKYVDTVVDATYDAKGYTLHKCSVCGSSYKSDYTDILVLGYVKNLKVTRQNPKFITLEWSMSTDGSGYEVEQYKGGKWVRISKTDSSANCALTVTNLTPGTSYTFRVRLRKVSGSTVQYGGYIRAVATTVLPNVTTFTAPAATSRTITLKWDKNADATGYVVEQYKGGKWTQILKTTGNTTLQCTASSLAPETRYSFRMKSYKKTGSAVVYSDYTNIAATTRIACVSGLTAKSSTVSSVTLSWNKVASATGYVVEIYKGGKWNTVLTTKNNTALSCKVTGLAAGSTYKARIKCYRLTNGAYSFSEYLEADVNTKIANVTGFKSSGNTASSITFSWNKNTAATGYIVEIYKGGKWTQILNAKSNTTLTCTATGLSANATYSVRIKSFKKTTATTYFSDYLTFSADTRIPNVTSLTYKADSASQVTLSWRRNTAADGYTVEIYRGGKWEQVLCATSNTKLSCKITGLAEGSTYSVRIKSYKVKNGRTVFSEYLKSTATTGLNPVAKLGEQANSTASSIRFSWTRKSCATGYIVEIYKGGKWNLVTKTTSNTVTSCQITNLNAGTSYTCRVRAYLTVNGSTIYSDNVRTVQKTK